MSHLWHQIPCITQGGPIRGATGVGTYIHHHNHYVSWKLTTGNLLASENTDSIFLPRLRSKLGGLDRLSSS